MKTLKKGLILVMLIGNLATVLSACSLREKRPLTKAEVLVSLKTAYNINVETVFSEFKVTRNNDLKMLYFNEMNDKLTLCGDPNDGYNVLYIKTDKGEHKLVYYVPNLVNRGGIRFTAKDGICITEFPLDYTLDDLYEKVLLIEDEKLKDSIKDVFYNKFASFASFNTIFHNHAVRYVYDNDYFFAFDLSPKTYMIIMGDGLYIVKDKQCVYPSQMSLGALLVRFDSIK